MQPSYLPLQLKLFLYWQHRGVNEKSSVGFHLPALDSVNAGPTLVGLPSQESNRPWHSNVATEITPTTYQTLLARSWANVLLQSAPTAADRRAEVYVWLPNWTPAKLQLAESESIDVTKGLTPYALGSSTSGTLTVGQLWQQFVLDVLESSSIEDATALDLNAPQSSEIWNQPADELSWLEVSPEATRKVLNFQRNQPTMAGITGIQFLVALAIVIFSGLSWLVTQRWFKTPLIKWMELVWPAWACLALAAWVLLPVAWPAIVLTFCTLIVLWRRYRELKRDRQFVLLPRAIR